MIRCVRIRAVSTSALACASVMAAPAHAQATSAVSSQYQSTPARPHPATGTSPPQAQTSNTSAAHSDVAEPAEIIVTARKRSERAIDVPIALTTFQGQALEKRGARSVADVLNESPGVGVYDTGDGLTKVTIRGISTSLGANENGYYLDDLPFTGVTVPLSPDVRAWDLDRVEVLRGPQGTLFGEGSMGGTIRILTHGADLNDWEVKGSTSLSETEGGGTNDGFRGAVNVPVVPGVFAIRVAGTHEHFDGWIDDPVNDRKNVNVQKFDTLRVKARLDPTDRLSVTGSYWYYNARFPGGGSTATDQGNVSRSLVLSSATKYRLLGLNAKYDLGFAQLFYGFAHNKFDLPENGQYLGGTLNAGIDIKVDSHELRLASNPGHRLQWTVGAYLRKAERQDLFDFALFGLNSVDTTNSDARALFGEATYSIPNANVDLTAGLRYYHEKLSGNELSAGVTTPFPTTPYNSWNPRFSIAWHPRKNSTIYATASKGFRAGQFQPLESVQLGQLFGITLPPSLKQDFIWTYELGAKADFLHGALTAEGALFYSDWKNVTVRIPIATTGFNGLINSPGTHTKGVELSILARPISRLTLEAGGSLIDAHYTGAVPGTGIVAGADVEDVAKFTANASADYHWPIGRSVQGTARIGWQHTSPRNNTSFPIFERGDTINRVDARIGADFGNFTVALFADNLTNDRGATSYRSVQPIAPGDNDVTSSRLRPRTFGIELYADLSRPAH